MILDMVIGDWIDRLSITIKNFQTLNEPLTLSEARRMMGSYLLYRLDVTAHQCTQY